MEFKVELIFNKTIKIRLTDKEYFEITHGGAVSEFEPYPELEDLGKLKILGIGWNSESELIIELENGKKLFVEAKNEIALQCLKKIERVLREKYIGKKLSEVIDKDFCVEEDLN